MTGGTPRPTSADGFTGFDFNDDRDGVWFEGTGQMAVAFAASGRPLNWTKHALTLRVAQQLFAGGGLAAASYDSVTVFLRASAFGSSEYRTSKRPRGTPSRNGGSIPTTRAEIRRCRR